MTSSGLRRKTALRWAKWLLAGLIVVLALPYLIAPLYRFIDPPSTLMVGRRLLGKRVDHTNVPLTRVAPILSRSVIASEDGQFCRHHGIDLAELKASIEDADDLSEARGGSTITQQVAKNLVLWPGRSLVRKGLEFPLAIWIDLVLPKQRIMEIYLNVAEWGPNGEFGIEAGSRYAFNRLASQLSSSEAALLAAMLPNPKRRSAKAPRPGVRRVAAIIQARASKATSIDACLRGS